MGEKTKVYKILLYGLGSDYNHNINNIKYQEMLGTIRVVGVTDMQSTYPCLDGYPYVKTEELKKLDIDYIVVTTRRYYKEIRTKLLGGGIEGKRIIPVSVFRIPNFDFNAYVELLNSKVSIIAQNCWGGHTYHSLRMQFLSPFINMSISDENFIKLLKNLRGYLEEEISFLEYKYVPRMMKSAPVAMLGDISICFNHYDTYEEGEKKWYERLKRINWDNLFIMMYTDSRKTVEEFDKLPFKKKICFVPFRSECLSAHTVIMNNNKELWEIVNGTAKEQYADYDAIHLLLSGQVNHDRFVN